MTGNDRLSAATADAGAALAGGAGQPVRAAAERRCILTGQTAPRDGLIRLALAPDGGIIADVAGRLPGRGAWISADRALFDSVAARGRLRGALARALRTQQFHLADDLGPQIEQALARRLLDRLGLENRAGNLVMGADRVREALARTALAGRGARRVHLVLHAADARPDGADRLDGMARAVGETIDAAIGHRHLPFDRDALSAALGRDNVVHVAVMDDGAAARIAADLARWQGMAGTDAAAPADTAPATNFAGGWQRSDVAPGPSEGH
jgi:hypothetical protein